MCAYLVVVTGYFAYEITRRNAFIAGAATTTGVVVSLEPRPLAGTTRVHTVGDDVPRAPEVRYVVNGRTYFYTPPHGIIGSEIGVGDSIEVLYDPANPARARLQNEGQWLLPIITGAFGATAVALFVVLIATRNQGVVGRRPAAEPKRARD